MIKILSLLILIHVILNESTEECRRASADNCNEIEIDIKGYGCFNYKTVSENETESGCIPLSINKKNQLIDLRIYDYTLYEVYSLESGFLNNLKTLEYKSLVSESGYDLSEIVQIKKEFSNKDLEIFKSNNSCIFNAEKFYLNSKNNEEILSQNEIKQKCFSVPNYEKAKDIMSCGFCSITIKKNEESKTINTCLMIPSIPILKDKAIQKYYQAYIFNLYMTLFNIKTNSPFDIFRRNLEETNIKMTEISLEDRNGNEFTIKPDEENNFEIKIEKEITKEEGVKFKLKYCLYNDDLISVKILEKKNKAFVYHSLESEDYCSWSSTIKIEENFKFKFILYKEGSILRWELGKYREIKYEEISTISNGNSSTGDLGGCMFTKENGALTLDCSWNKGLNK